jgi:hypothetical protein
VNHTEYTFSLLIEANPHHADFLADVRVALMTPTERRARRIEVIRELSRLYPAGHGERGKARAIETDVTRFASLRAPAPSAKNALLREFLRLNDGKALDQESIRRITASAD